MDLLQKFIAHIKQQDLFHKNDKLIVAVSGGVDSVVLCTLCAAAGFQFSMSHCNFQLRGAESDADELLVKELAEKLQVPFLTKRFDTKAYKEEHKKGTQEAARDLRYAWFAESIDEAKQNNPTKNVYLLTAHHAGDNAETVLYNFLRGSGLKGLTGIPQKRDFIRRPLLFATKKELLDYAAQNNIEFRNDASNSTNDYTRNYLRNSLLPELEKIIPTVQQNLNETSHRYSDIKKLYDEAIAQKIKKVVELKGAEMHLPILKLQKTIGRESVLHEIVKPLGYTTGQETEIWKILDSETGKFVNSPSHRIFKNRNWLIIAPLQNELVDHILIEQGESNIAFAGGEIVLKHKKVPDQISTSPELIELDSKAIEFPLLLRRWKKGDYFYPLGMQKKKKLSRFFIDQKLSLTQKENVWVLESNKKIIWILGLRIDDRFKITPSTKEVLEIKLASK